MEDGRFKLDDFELYNVARSFRRKVYQRIRQLPPEEHNSSSPQLQRHPGQRRK